MNKLDNTVREPRTIFWEVDGSSGSTQLKPCTLYEAMRYWDFFFKPYGYHMIGISRG